MLGEDQWETRLLCSVEQLALLDKFIIEIHRSNVEILQKFENDATACYDQMIRNLITLCSCHLCVPDKVYKSKATDLKNMKYYIQ